jgi:hypothetical protein
MARFSEVFRCSGVDENPNVPGKPKVPGMVIRAGGFLDDREKSIREEIARALGLKAKEESFPECAIGK